MDIFINVFTWLIVYPKALVTVVRRMVGLFVLVVVAVEGIAEPLVVLVTAIVVVVGHIAVLVERIVVAPVVERIVGVVVHTVVHVVLVCIVAVGSMVVERMLALGLGLVVVVVAGRRTRWSTGSTFQ